MYKFFVDKKEGNHFILDKKLINHIKVVRINQKEFICIYKKEFYICKMDEKKALILKKLENDHEFKNSVILGMSYIKPKKFELTIQKAAELGVTNFIPIISKNVSIKIQEKYERWNEIAVNASEQSFRNTYMNVDNQVVFEDAIKNIKSKHKYIAHVSENNEIINHLETDSFILIGPEGGFTDEEVKLAKDNNFKVISFGKRILRAETAAIFALSNLRENE
ncbi:MAG: 16S rRNA (uracil(1498)-N(3))-methyltransferase [Mycoplasma sp.]|nr:16S rRNA (uracil(1498)-N(3))-methyltransferase [Mycoplasma sp.]